MKKQDYMWENFENYERGLVNRPPKQTLQDLLIEEIEEAQISRKEYIPLLPIVMMFEKMDNRMYLAKARDYLWFGDEYEN